MLQLIECKSTLNMFSLQILINTESLVHGLPKYGKSTMRKWKLEKKKGCEVGFYLEMETARGKIKYNLEQGSEVIEYLFFSSSSFLTFSQAFL